MLALALAPAVAAVLKPAGGAAAVAAGMAATAFATQPAVHYHPHSQADAVSRDAAGRITACPDRCGLAAATQGVAGAGPKELTDATGRRFWRFEGAEYLNVAAALVADNRACAVFLVGRQHRNGSGHFVGLGNVAAGTVANTGSTLINTAGAGGLPPYLRGGSRGAQLDPNHGGRVVAGSQLQVLGVVSRTSAQGDQRLYANGEVAAVGQNSIGAAAAQGAEIGRYPFAPGAAGSWAQFDLYELAIFTGVLANPQADAIAAAMVANWAIPAVTHQLVVEGDSITQGVGDIPSGRSLAMLLSDPGGASAAPAGWRVINMGVSGNTVPHLVTRRDAAETLYGRPLPGRNVVMCQIGRNNLGALGETGAAVYAQVVALLHAAGTGYLERGWEVRQAVNIAVASSLAAENEALRGRLRAPAFLTDCAAGAGQAFAGRLGLVELPLVGVAGSGTIFDTVADAGDPMWYQPDATHPSTAGTAEMARAYRGAI